MATTENPSFTVNRALLSRCLVYDVRPLGPDAMATVLRRAAAEGFDPAVTLSGDALDYLIRLADGDARAALTSLEAAALPGSTPTVDELEKAIQRRAARYDRDGDAHYDYASALISP